MRKDVIGELSRGMPPCELLFKRTACFIGVIENRLGRARSRSQEPREAPTSIIRQEMMEACPGVPMDMMNRRKSLSLGYERKRT